jgi:hypothetical protein
MQATHGLVVSSLRSRIRVIGTLAIALALSALVLASTASARMAPPPHTYLALGDSLAFGYSQQLFNENEHLGDPTSAFEAGYANDYLKMARVKHENRGLVLVNDGCPGETTDSMIGDGPLATAMEADLGAKGEAPCAYHTVDGLPLHNEYGAGKSQLENVLETIAVGAATSKPVTLLTLNIGANDELHQIAACERQVGEEVAKGEVEPTEPAEKAALKKCIEEHVFELFEHILRNIGASLYVIRNGSEFGGVNYEGKIVVQGGYDPYGNVLGTGELLENSNALVSLLNEHEAALVTAKDKLNGSGEPEFGAEACYANPQARFNPENKKEPERLSTLTNMANTTEYEGKKNGPDIHPTPLGYLTLARIMRTDCGV